VERSRSLHETVVLLTVEEVPLPVLAEASRYRVVALCEGFYRLIVFFGYMEEPVVLPVLRQVSKHDHIPFNPENATYYIGHETIIAKDRNLHRVPEAIFSYLSRNAIHEEVRYGMPPRQVVEIGTQVFL
jgi:KUP system potassium uptake protein